MATGTTTRQRRNESAPSEDVEAEDTVEPTDTAAGGDDEQEPSPYAHLIKRTTTKHIITFRGRKFAIPRARAQWPTRAMQIFQRGTMERFPDAVELMLGPTQWDTFNEVAPLVGDFWEFFPILAEALGFQRVDSDTIDAAKK
ncbi:hypothetical protein [Mycolicibacterium canariasense]|uniref:hypothetical protein n=1 Tax=Mycolicibacterium canariasense TaxID=228230 RepID=UPI0032D58843